MAYKFQRGAATLSGSIKAEDGLDANSAGFAGAGAIAGATTINASGAGTFGSLKIDDGSTIGSDTKGDAITIAANGDTEIADTCDFNIEGHNGTDTGLKLADTLVTSTAAELNLLDGAAAANNVASKAVILDGSGNLTLAGDLTINGTTTTVSSTTIEITDKNIQIAKGATGNGARGAGLDIELGGDADRGFIRVGASDDSIFELQAPGATVGHLLTIDMDAAGEIEFGAAKKLTVAGNFNIDGDISSTATEINLVDGSSAGTIVNSKAVIYGSSGEVNATTLQIAGSSITATAAELNVLDGLAAGRILVGDGTGAAAIVDASSNAQILVGNGSTLASVGISGDIALTNAGLTTIQAGAVEHGMLAEDIISGQSELGSASDLADADDMMIHDNNAGEVKKVGLDTLKTFFQTGVTADTAGGFSYSTFDVTSSAIANAAGNPGFYAASGSSASSPLSASVSATLHLSGGNALGDNDWSNGMVVYIKAPSNASSFNLTVVASGSERIDGEQQIVLESDNAAVTLLRCHNSRWSIV
tara:strand:- start:69 stop:1667 length:1599 start_codon:yes stop_codon:yes gene_type:complete